MRTIIIDYGSGNLRSVAKALERVAAGSGDIVVSDDPAQLRTASHIVLPGVGAFADCMRGLNALPGMRAALENAALADKKPFLGICVGMQMLFERGHEHGVHDGLGWLKGEVVKLGIRDWALGIREENNPQSLIPNASLKIPHMGWNDLNIIGEHPLLAGIAPGAHAYFVHSYHARCAQPQDMLATTHYGQTITAVVGQGNIMGTQFHPEKSQDTGLRLLKNFLGI